MLLSSKAAKRTGLSQRISPIKITSSATSNSQQTVSIHPISQNLKDKIISNLQNLFKLLSREKGTMMRSRRQLRVETTDKIFWD